MSVSAETLEFLAHVVTIMREDGGFISVATSEAGYSTADKAYKRYVSRNIYGERVERPDQDAYDVVGSSVLWFAARTPRSGFEAKLQLSLNAGLTRTNYRIIAALPQAYESAQGRLNVKPPGTIGQTIDGVDLRLRGAKGDMPGFVRTDWGTKTGAMVLSVLNVNLMGDTGLEALILGDKYLANFEIEGIFQSNYGVYIGPITTVKMLTLWHTNEDTGENEIVLSMNRVRKQKRKALLPNLLGAPPEGEPKLRQINLTEDD